jgi:type II secretory pathway pseudopilin PulG
MMSFTATKSQSGRHRGFTLVEMLVVIGIIILLIGILLPAINIAYTHAVRNRMALDIQSISTALEAYKGDARSYPQLDYSDTNGIMKAAYPASVLLCRCLIGPGSAAEDGTAGPGFTQVPNGQVYGPYLEVGKFKLVYDPVLGTSTPNNNYIADRYNHPILYFRANLSADPTTNKGYVNYVNNTTGPYPMYNLWDDAGSAANPALVWTIDGATTTKALERMCMMLGDVNNNQIIDGSEQAFTKTPYLLWSAGPDEVFGIDLSGTGNNNSQPASLPTLASRVPAVDDATNFKQ